MTLVPDDIYVHNLRIDYTMKNRNPLTKVGFYEVGKCWQQQDGWVGAAKSKRGG